MAQALGPYTIETWERLPADGNRYELLVTPAPEPRHQVLSPSSARYDRGAKRARYLARAAEYWIVDPDARVVERWRPGEDRPLIVRDRLLWQPAPAVPALAIELDEVFAELPE